MPTSMPLATSIFPTTVRTGRERRASFRPRSTFWTQSLARAEEGSRFCVPERCRFKRAGTVLSVGFALLVGSGLGPAAHGLDRPGIKVTPHVAPPTTQVHVIGLGFASNETVELLLDSVVLTETQADDAGSFRQALRLPRQV